MRIAVGGLIIGTLLTLVLMIVAPVLMAGPAVVLVGVVVQVYWLRRGAEPEPGESIGFWIIIGAVIPVYCWVLKGFAGVL
ncbi:MAG: hypothetical protein QM399_01895 [Bacillota bacterium]|nr:hypothetical protein [Bacillota bacterium]